MPVEFDYDSFRALAKRLKLRLQNTTEIKHTDVLADMAAAVGYRVDALMHALKAEKDKQPLSAEESFVHNHIASIFPAWNELPITESMTAEGYAYVGCFSLDALFAVAAREGSVALEAMTDGFIHQVRSLAGSKQLFIGHVHIDIMMLVILTDGISAKDTCERLFAPVSTQINGPRFPIKMTITGGVTPLKSPGNLRNALGQSEKLMRNLQQFRSGEAKHMWSAEMIVPS